MARPHLHAVDSVLDVTFAGSMEQLDTARRAFRHLNRALRAASFTVAVDFADE